MLLHQRSRNGDNSYATLFCGVEGLARGLQQYAGKLDAVLHTFEGEGMFARGVLGALAGFGLEVWIRISQYMSGSPSQ